MASLGLTRLLGKTGRPPSGSPTKPSPLGFHMALPSIACAVVLAFVVGSSIVSWLHGGGPGPAALLLGEAGAGALFVPWYLLGWLTRWLFVAGGALGAVAQFERSGGRWDGIDLLRDSDLQWGIGFALLAVVILVLNSSVHRDVPRYRMASPFGRGRYLVAHGGARIVNHHARVPRQRFAVDLIRARPIGLRTRALVPRSLPDYLSYGEPVVSPVAGTVIESHDHRPDIGSPLPVEGNCVIIEPHDRPGWRVLLAHLRPGSVAVAEGQPVTPGQLVGEIGNTGNSSEPHLHLHLEDERGVGVAMLVSRRRPLSRNGSVRAEPGGVRS
jgi:hypothetical protein